MDRPALLVVDVQNDFCPGGALPVPEGGSILPQLNRVVEAFRAAGQPIFFTRDWHPSNHCSFKAQGGPWPPHCVQRTKGAEFHPGLVRPQGSTVISKGGAPEVEAYSGFAGTDLAARLRKLGTDTVYVGGLTIEHCVRTTTEDALRNGFHAVVVSDCVKGLDVHKGDSAAALAEMRKAGAAFTSSSELVAKIVGTQQ